MVRILAVCAFLPALALPAEAVIVLESKWRQEGGTKGHKSAGFGAHLRLAAEPQFRSVLAFSTDGESWGEASGTWIGNDDRHAYILTAAHVYELPAETDAYVVRGPDGEVLTVDKIWIHPQWNGDNDTRTGYDFAVVRLTKPLTGLGPQPVLYSGNAEAGKLITFVGYGNRGTGKSGDDEAYYEGSGKAAAQGIVDDWTEAVTPLPEDDEGGNYLGIYLPKEDGSVPNPYGGSSKPATDMVGLLGEGDSGGSAWMKLGANWVIVGVNSGGSGDATYGESSWFGRISMHRRWLTRIFPGAKFTE